MYKQLKKEGVKRVKLAFTDIDGIHRGKYISLDKFASVLENGAGFCDCVLGWDCNDQLYDNATFTGWHTAFPDARYQIETDTLRRLPDEDNTPLFLVSFYDQDNNSHPLCPRSILKETINRANEMNIDIKLAFEYEFFVFNETPHSIREKNYTNLTPFTPGNFGYSILRNSAHADLYHEFMDYCINMGFPLEGLHCETGPGVWEGALHYDDALKMADAAALFKTFSKAFFQKRGMLATFMAKWSMDYPGQSGHVHQSLYDKKSGKNLFYADDQQGNMSEVMCQYIAGQQRYLKELLAMSAPTINSYTRLVKGYWAPTAATWGIENRTAALRVIPGNEKSQRIEFRLGAADANPYLVSAAIITAGLAGINEKLSPTPAMAGNCYEQEDTLDERYRLASNLRDATRQFAQSTLAQDAFGQQFVEHYSASRLWEVREYERHINDWQLQRYFEII